MDMHRLRWSYKLTNLMRNMRGRGWRASEASERIAKEANGTEISRNQFFRIIGQPREVARGCPKILENRIKSTILLGPSFLEPESNVSA